MATETAITVSQLSAMLEHWPPPVLVDVRRAAAFERDPVRIPFAIRRPPDLVAAWSHQAEPWRTVIAYCVHGHEVSQDAATTMRAAGLDARYLVNGFEGWKDAGHAVEPVTPPTHWVTRARPKVDRIACPWLIRRFIDADAVFHYVPPAGVLEFAQAHGAMAFDVPDVDYTHVGAQCSFDAFMARHALSDPALLQLATIVRAADTGTLEQAAPAAGLLAVSLGLSAMLVDDHAMLRWGLLTYDALYAWCRSQQGEQHGWNPDVLRAAARR